MSSSTHRDPVDPADRRTAPIFPFAALVGLDTLKTALQLAAIDPRLSVLARGDKGAGKSTAARALGDLLADDAPFINLPLGATEDRLLGGLDIDGALAGHPKLKPGLLAEADGGVLYVDEVNLLPDHLADALLDAVASGVHVVEREGFSVTQDASFALIGSMNPEEGSLRPQLLDRFALAVDVSAPMDPAMRRQAVERRLEFDTRPEAFIRAWRTEQEALATRLRLAHAGAASVVLPEAILDYITTTVTQHAIRSLRADLAIVRASRALAALEGAPEVTQAHVDAVLPLALSHRAPAAPPRSSPPPPRDPSPPPPAPSQRPSDDERRQDSQESAADRSGSDGGGVSEQIFAARPTDAPRIVLSSTRDESSAPRRGAVIGSRRIGDPATRSTDSPSRSGEPRELDLRGSIVHALGQTGVPQPRREDLHEKIRAPHASTRYLFVIDSSGSHAVQQRMALVKGAVNGLLDTSVRHRDEVMVIAFRGAGAEVVLAPTRSADAARLALAYLPTGGRTPLAHGLELAAGHVTDDTVLVLVTDGRANVASRGADPWADALQAAAAITCPALVIDTETGAHATGRARQLAEAMRATHIMLEGLDEAGLLEMARRVPERSTSTL